MTTVPFQKRHVVEPRWARDVPRGSEVFTNIAKYGKKEIALKGDGNKFFEGEEEELEWVKKQGSTAEQYVELTPSEKRKTLREMFFASFCLAADGYVNNSTNVINTGLKALYGPQYTNSTAISNISAIVYAGEIVSMLFFGTMCDILGRKTVTLAGNAIMIIFSILTAGAWVKGAQSSPTESKFYLDKKTGKHYPVGPASLFSYICFLRFMVGVGIGSEYPGASSWTTDISKKLKPKNRNMWIILFTNSAISVGFFASALVTLIVVAIAGPSHYVFVWRWVIGLGAVMPLIFFIGRMRMPESESFTKNRFKKSIPYGKTLKFYWYRLTVFSLAWFCFDLVSYGFGGVSSMILGIILGKNSSQTRVWSFNLLFQSFSLVGSVFGCRIASNFGIRYTGTVSTYIQGIIGFCIYGKLETLKQHVAGFTVLYGIFSALGQVGFGNNLGLMCSTGFATPVRGSMYCICSAIGKAGALAAGYIFPKLIVHGGIKSSFILGGIFAFVSGSVLLLAPPLDQVSQQLEDKRFAEYLEAEGYDISLLTSSDLTIRDTSDEEEIDSYSKKDEVNMKTISSKESV
jgi:MFS family permease